MKQLTCPNCQTPLTAADLKLDAGLAICPNCRSVLQLDAGQAPDLTHKKFPVSTPDGIELYPGTLGMEILIPWKKMNKGVGPILFFTLVWDAFILFFIAIILLSGSGFIPLVFMSLHILVGIGLTYYCLSVLLNTTSIYVSQSDLLISHRPLKSPFNKDRSMEPKDIEQIYVERYVASTTNKQPNYAFKVLAVMRDGDKITLLKGITRLPYARFIEKEIERFLGLKDRQVEGEYLSS